jgi:hypothetical protein
VINFFDQGPNQLVNFCKISDEAAVIQFAPHDDIDAIVVAMHSFAFVAIRNERQTMRRLEAVCSANPRFQQFSRAGHFNFPFASWSLFIWNSFSVGFF